MKPRLRWGILGTGNIARQFACSMAESQRGELAAVGSRTAASAHAFAAAHRIPTAWDSYDALLADRSVDAVYISLPNTLHCMWAIRALRAGKHVLCEKPIATSSQEAQAMFAEARSAGCILAEAFMYRSHPLTAAWLKEIRDGAIGQPRLVRSSFCYCTRQREGNIRFNREMAGGALMDVGCYCISLSRLVAGEEPAEVTAAVQISDAGIDEVAAGTLSFANGLIASFTCGMALHADNTASICGTQGFLEIPIPWKPPSRDAGFVLSASVPPLMDAGTRSGPAPLPGSGPRRIIRIDAGAPPLALEADDLAAAVLDGSAPTVSEADSLGNMAVLDKMRALAGLG